MKVKVWRPQPKDIIASVVSDVEGKFIQDQQDKNQFVHDLKKQIRRHEEADLLRADWAMKRVQSIFREVERLGLVITGFDPGVGIKATFQGVPMIGEVFYQKMDRIEAYKEWKRPKIVVSFWVLDSKGQKCFLSGHTSEALKIVFGTHRMLAYNRLFAAVLDAMAR